MNRIQIFIDGKPVIAEADQTILKVCRDQGLHIPSLCYDDQIEPFTSCFLCVVDVEGARTLVPACGTKIYQGMKITTDNQEIQEARKMALELILSNHYADCLGPCRITCPAGVDVQGYLALSSMGKYREAIELIKKNNPLPTVCGRVCTRPCEMNCRRNLVDEAAAIDHVKRFVADVDLESPNRFFPEVKEDTGLKVAIIGAGPAGLSCAYYLRQEGHIVDIFDAKPKAGGMLRWGIPQYRLPEEILDKEVEGITELGVSIYYNSALGRDYSLEDLFDKGYKAVFLGLGAQSSSSMRVENEDAEGVLSGIDFLDDIKMNQIDSLTGKVAVIGGGNTAMDAARSALRLGADEVHILYRRTLKEMPANKMEIDEAEEEGIIFTFLTAPVKVVLDEEGRAKGLECLKMELGPPDASGRRRPEPIDGSNFVIELDWIIAAIGQKPDLEFAANDSKLVEVKQTRWGTLDIKNDTKETNIPGVFSGGDVVLGPATAVEAIADGRSAAMAIHKFITGEKLELAKKPFISRKDTYKEQLPEEYQTIAKTTREKMAVRDPDQRKKDWNEIELGFTPEQVFNEAIRCLECGCQAFFDCDLQKYSTDYEANQENYLGEYHDIEPDKSHPFIQMELNKCILCGRCVRICDEVMGLGVFGFVKRGYETKVKPVLEMPLAESHCISCGQCVETCPTGALSDRVDALKPGPWILEKYPTVCQYCSVGCRMNADVLENRVIKVSAYPESEVNDYGNLCVKGRYGFRYVNDENRLKQPLVRKNGELQPVSWDEAITFASQKIKFARVNEENWAVFGSPHSSNEENFLLQKLARIALQSNNIGSFSDTDEFPEQLLRASFSNTTFKYIEESDFLLVFNFDPMETHPVLYIKLQKAARKGQQVYMCAAPGSKLGSKSHELNIPEDKKALFIKFLVDHLHKSSWYDKISTRTIGQDFKTIFEYVDGISDKTDLSEFNLSKRDFNEFWKALLKAEKPLFIYDRSKANADIIHWLNSLAVVLGRSDSLLSLPAAVNFQGMLDMGMHPQLLPGYQKVDNKQAARKFEQKWDTGIIGNPGKPITKILEEAANNHLKGLIIWNQDPAGTGDISFHPSEKMFMIVADMFLTETAKMADVVFPLAPFIETSGSVTNAEGRILKFNRVLKPATGYENWKIIADIISRAGYRTIYQTAEDIYQEILLFVAEYRREIALFRNGYSADPYLVVGINQSPQFSTATFLDKWFENFAINNRSQKKAEIPTAVFTEEKK